jgi:ADP-ribose pyrophosphatase
MKNPWKKINQRHVYEHNPFLKVRKDHVFLPNGKLGIYSVIERPDTVIMICSSTDNKIYFVRQWRYPINKASLELPMGLINKGESTKSAAIRELQEETGVKAKNWQKISNYYPANGLTTNKVHVFIAEEKKKVKVNPDPSEYLEIEKYSFKKIKQMIKDEKIKDGFTITALWYYEKFKENNN